jgi:hypothetical protein
MSYFSTKSKSHLDYLDDFETRSYWKPSSVSYGWSKGSRSWSKSAWSSFSYLEEDEEESDLFVKSPDNYVTPTSKDIKNKTNVWKQTSIDTIKEIARVCYFKMIDEKEYIDEKYTDFDNLSDSDKALYIQKKTFYDNLFDQFIPGFTPLEQAIAIYLKMQKVEYDEDGYPIEREDDELDMSKGLDFDRELYTDPTINEQLEINELSKEYKMDIMNKISIIGNLGQQFKVEKEVDEKIVVNSDEYLKKVMRDYSQFHMIDLYQKMFPNFRTKFLTKDLVVNVPVDRKEQKQKIIILLDFSGSMHENEKQIWVNAILIDRFRYVIKGEAEVFFSYFVDDSDRLNFKHIKNREDVVKFWQTFSNEPDGGETRIGDMVNRVADEILVKKKLMNLEVDLSEEKPEILIVNDGQDSVKTHKFPYKTNAISLMGFSDELKNLCVETEGKQVEVEEGNIVSSYSSEGKQLISK